MGTVIGRQPRISGYCSPLREPRAHGCAGRKELQKLPPGGHGSNPGAYPKLSENMITDFTIWDLACVGFVPMIFVYESSVRL